MVVHNTPLLGWVEEVLAPQPVLEHLSIYGEFWGYTQHGGLEHGYRRYSWTRNRPWWKCQCKYLASQTR